MKSQMIWDSLEMALQPQTSMRSIRMLSLRAVLLQSQAEFNQKMITMALSGSQEFDIIWISARDVGVLANGGVLLNLDDYYANETRFDIQNDEEWIVNTTNNFINYKGSTYAFPYQTDCRIAFYYKPICEEVGYTAENYPRPQMSL